MESVSRWTGRRISAVRKVILLVSEAVGGSAKGNRVLLSISHTNKSQSRCRRLHFLPYRLCADDGKRKKQL